MIIIRVLFGFAAGVLVAAAAASIAHTQMSLHALGIDIPMADRVATTLFDLHALVLNGQPVSFSIVIAVGFAIAFPVAALMRRVLKAAPFIAYPLAGAAAIGLIHALMYLAFDASPIAGARGAGLFLQMAAGALGGAVFAAIAVKRP